MGSLNSVTELNDLFVEAMNAGDLELAMSCWDEDTVFQTAPGTDLVTGPTDLRAAIQAFIDLKPVLTTEELHRVEAGDVTLVALKWHLEGTGSDGKPLEMGAIDSNVFCRKSDGTWRIRIDNPFHSQHIGG